ncbi:ADP-ribosylation/Crystallin J1 [Xylariales sp. PMI_506]|nr:ADP-ribosylation/Crystallin J1 [Xylariales sp. PMI_506]
MSSPFPPDYLERVYSGVLGKLVGVYVGRPFENWTHQQILAELGPIDYYVHEKLGMPLVVVDDDVSGTFTFVRSLEEHGISLELSSEQIGQTWLNTVIEKRSIFWWGGKGISTEHTAFLNLKNGIPAPASGAISTNGQTLAEQIGAQIFIDGWAMVVPGRPELAAKLAAAAGLVSHDGEAVYAAQLWAAMEAEAFISKDINHLLDTGLKYIPSDSKVARLIRDIRAWAVQDRDWMKTRQRIEDNYGYDKFHGICHVIPNHGIMVLAMLYGGHDFHKAMHIVNTSGWDTDCNAGNVGCLVAIMHGVACFKNGPDWLGPLADRAIISSADGGYSINNAARIAMDLAKIGFQLANKPIPAAPKDGAQFHFTLPGSVQGFRASDSRTKVEQRVDSTGVPGLSIQFQSPPSDEIEILTDTFISKEVLEGRASYELMASPLIYPGQELKSVIRADESTTSTVRAQLRLKTYSGSNQLVNYDSLAILLEPGRLQTLEWIIPDIMDSQPIQEVGIVISAPSAAPVDGLIWLQSLQWAGTPNFTLRRPKNGPGDFWHRAWVKSVTNFHMWAYGPSFLIGHDQGEGLIIQGTRDWIDYTFEVDNFIVNLGSAAGLIVRYQGLNRYYALMLVDNTRLSLVKAFDRERIEIASVPFPWKLDEPYRLAVAVHGQSIRARIGDVELCVTEGQHGSGGVGLIVLDGSVSAESMTVSPLK